MKTSVNIATVKSVFSICYADYSQHRFRKILHSTVQYLSLNTKFSGNNALLLRLFINELI